MIAGVLARIRRALRSSASAACSRLSEARFATVVFIAHGGIGDDHRGGGEDDDGDPLRSYVEMLTLEENTKKKRGEAKKLYEIIPDADDKDKGKIKAVRLTDPDGFLVSTEIISSVISRMPSLKNI